MVILFCILGLLLWFSPYWWLPKCSEETADSYLVGAIIMAIFPLFFGEWIVTVAFLAIEFNFYIAYYKEFVYWEFSDLFASKSSHKKAHADFDNDLTYVKTSYTQDQEMKEFIHNIASTHRPDNFDKIYDSDRDIDYNKVSELNDDMRSEIAARSGD